MNTSDLANTSDIDTFFNPKRVALVGASSDYRKLGNSILMNLLASEIEIYPISRSSDYILGTKVYPSLSDLPVPVDLVILAVAAKYCPSLMIDIKKAGASHAVVISGGFSEIGQDGVQLEKELIEAARNAGVFVVYIKDTLLKERISDSPGYLRRYMISAYKGITQHQRSEQ